MRNRDFTFGKMVSLNQKECEKSMRGQLGQPLRLFSELNFSLQKLDADSAMISQEDPMLLAGLKRDNSMNGNSECRTEGDLDE